MRRGGFFIITLLLLVISMVSALGQDCDNYHKKGDCMMDQQKGFRIYSQSRSAPVSILEQVAFNVMFYGQKNYILSFCTSKHLYPVHYRLVDPDSRKVLYDNASDRYVSSLEVGFDVTRTLLIEADVLAETASSKQQRSEPGCMGLLIQYDNY